MPRILEFDNAVTVTIKREEIAPTVVRCSDKQGRIPAHVGGAMKVGVLGGGIIGVTTAYQLAKSGHEVVVFDRRSGPALETSFANSGEVSFGYCSPWAAPGIPLKALKWMTMENAPFILRPRADPAMISWLVRMLSNCTAARYAVNKSRMLRLADYSRIALADLRAETGIKYDERMGGTLQLFRTQKQLDAAAKDVEALAADGIPFEVLDREGCVRVEPALARVREKVVGGLLTPQDETGDCFKFAAALAARCHDMGVDFRFDADISGLVVEGGKIASVVTANGRIQVDAAIAALGSHTPIFLRPYGVRVPVYPVKGYSLTIPITDASLAPESTVMDETYKIAITRLGDRIRVGGMAEVSGYTTDLPEARRRTLELSVGDLFPGGDMSRATFWSGLRPMTPDGTPVIGPTAIRGLFLNTGHGTLGWTMSAGSARVVADLVCGREPEIDTSDLALSRYAR